MNEGDQIKIITGIDQIKSVPVELSESELEVRKQDELFLLGGPEELVREAKAREKAREQEVIELQSGEVRTLKSYLVQDALPYFPKFPNDVPFYSEIYRVADIDKEEWNPNDFYKPPIIAVLTNELIYSRFGRTMVLDLRKKTIVQGIRLKKFFQYFDTEGQKKVIEFRDDAINMLKNFKKGELYEFRLAYSTQYGTSFQLKITNG